MQGVNQDLDDISGLLWVMEMKGLKFFKMSRRRGT
jgi:hypothetical protein